MKYIKVIKKTPTGEKVVDIQTSIWESIVKGDVKLPEGTSYELAPQKSIEEATVELMVEKPIDPELLSESLPAEDFKIETINTKFRKKKQW